MAQVTVNTRKVNYNGAVRQIFYNITGVTTNTLIVPFFRILKINFDLGTTITSYTVAAGTNPAQQVITFTSSGPFTSTNVEVQGT